MVCELAELCHAFRRADAAATRHDDPRVAKVGPMAGGRFAAKQGTPRICWCCWQRDDWRWRGRSGQGRRGIGQLRKGGGAHGQAGDRGFGAQFGDGRAGVDGAVQPAVVDGGHVAEPGRVQQGGGAGKGGTGGQAVGGGDPAVVLADGH